MWGYKRFFRRAMLETLDYLKDDCFKINCTVSVVISAVDCSSLHSIQVPDSDIGSHFGMLLENMEGSNIIFNVAGEKFQAYKLVLAARSPAFRSEFFEELDSDEQEIVVTEMEPKVFKAMLHFIYRDALVEDELIASSSGSPPAVTDTLTAKLLAAADRYDLGRLRPVMRSDGLEYLKENLPTLQSELLKTVAGAVMMFVAAVVASLEVFGPSSLMVVKPPVVAGG